MGWLQLELEVNQAQLDTLSELLEQLGAVSISLTASSDDAVFDTEAESKKLWDKTRLTALLQPDVDLDVLLVCLRNRVGAENIYQHKIERVKDKNWISEFQAEHPPILFSDRVCICPSWCDAPDSELPVIILDPGLAFGTGTHPTTSLCIEWLTENTLTEKILIDYGCGSGILAMVAATLGAKQVYAVDTDIQAVQTAKENIRRNKLSDRIDVGLVEDMSLPVADILVANIVMNPLKDLKETFANLLKTDGHIVLSGLLHVQAKDCLAVYADCFDMDAAVFASEWTRLHGVKTQ